eukprot:TRINITY_DN7036_c0_g1_i1.p1 TRINITY_DN7036_c0_g1~~TRINITY_DN7036_c0_g1_i1.p1  ORF type:complete len:502 (-),score=152.09 TRINITY_DN7036_c0_g1_i1:223-1728(-)
MVSESKAEDVFWSEITKLSRLRHPNLSNVYGFTFDENTAYLVSEPLQQKDVNLEEVIANKERYRLYDSIIVDIAISIAEAIAFLHTNGITHGALFPSNIVVRNVYKGKVKVSRFGLAKLNKSDPKTRSVFDAPEYNTTGPTFRTDVYSFGTLMCIMFKRDLWVDYEPVDLDDCLLGDLIASCWRKEVRPSFVEILASLREVRGRVLITPEQMIQSAFVERDVSNMEWSIFSQLLQDTLHAGSFECKLIRHCVKFGDDRVSLKAWEYLVGRFAPLLREGEENDEAGYSLSEIANIVGPHWFFDMDTEEAVDFLQNQAECDGIFMVRPSVSRGYFAITAKCEKHIYHWRIDGRKKGIFVFEGQEYRSLWEVVVRCTSGPLINPEYRDQEVNLSVVASRVAPPTDLNTQLTYSLLTYSEKHLDVPFFSSRDFGHSDDEDSDSSDGEEGSVTPPESLHNMMDYNDMKILTNINQVSSILSQKEEKKTENEGEEMKKEKSEEELKH